MEIIVIVAIDKNNAIGRKGDLVYHISADLKRFKQLTTGHTVVMGRRTFDSLPNGPLPNRRNFVLTHHPEGVEAECFTSLKDAVETSRLDGCEKLFVIGGASVYREALPLADRLELTVIEASTSDADTFFPPIENFDIQTQSEPMVDPKSGLSYRFVSMIAKKA